MPAIRPSSKSVLLPQVSREGESVPLGPNLKARGALEDWLTTMEENMRKVLHRFMKVALTELEGINFDGGNRAHVTRRQFPMLAFQQASRSMLG